MKIIMEKEEITQALILWVQAYHRELIGKSCDWCAIIKGDDLHIELINFKEKAPRETDN